MSLQSITRWNWILATIVAVPTVLAFAPDVLAANATVQFEIFKAGFIVGGSGGKGTLKLAGKNYPLEIGGVSLGATIGATKAELSGEVLNIKQASDIEGVYSAAQAGYAVVGGQKVAELKNSKGVVLKVRGHQVGLAFELDLSGLDIKLKK